MVEIIDMPTGPPHLVGCWGMGDNLYQRPFVRAACEKYGTVYLTTCYPELYWDIEERHDLRFVNPAGHCRLRAQKKNLARMDLSDVWCGDRAPGDSWRVPLAYTSRKFMLGPIVRAIEAGCPLGATPYDHRLPLRDDWLEEVAAISSSWDHGDRPIAIVRQNTWRMDWKCPARSPDQEAFHQARSLMGDRFFVVSVADLEDQQEGIIGEPISYDVAYHRGELTPGVIAALFSRAAMVLSPPGFAVPMCLAVGTPLFCVCGGFMPPEAMVDDRMRCKDLVHFCAPDPFCACMSTYHDCEKKIPADRVRAEWEAFERGLSGVRAVV